VKIDTNTQYWISDRMINGEPLMWSEFIKFISDLGAGTSDKTIKKYKTKSYRKLVKRTFAKYKEKYKSILTD